MITVVDELSILFEPSEPEIPADPQAGQPYVQGTLSGIDTIIAILQETYGAL